MVDSVTVVDEVGDGEAVTIVDKAELASVEPAINTTS